MRILIASVVSLRPVGPDMYVLSVRAPEIASSVLPAQFLNIKVNDLPEPLLRRPFSVYRTDGENVEILFNVVGTGTRILAGLRPGATLDILGPLGCSYGVGGDFATALLVGGGLGVAPFPITTAALERAARPVRTFLGARTRAQLVRDHLVNVSVATDDGSEGFRGTVVGLLRQALERGSIDRPKIFGCGPNVMLRALAALAAEYEIPCEVSLESVMACGIGICQGCPVERTGQEKKYSLICKEGTVFDARTITFAS
jgi:dihydroorotate dehydrogenase electron transfer subunit